jgi:hypothetical protein
MRDAPVNIQKALQTIRMSIRQDQSQTPTVVRRIKLSLCHVNYFALREQRRKAVIHPSPSKHLSNSDAATIS